MPWENQVSEDGTDQKGNHPKVAVKNRPPGLNFALRKEHHSLAVAYARKGRGGRGLLKVVTRLTAYGHLKGAQPRGGPTAPGRGSDLWP